MIVKLEDRVAVMERARVLMGDLSMNAFDALIEAEKEYIKQMKIEGEENE